MNEIKLRDRNGLSSKGVGTVPTSNTFSQILLSKFLDESRIPGRIPGRIQGRNTTSPTREIASLVLGLHKTILGQTVTDQKSGFAYLKNEGRRGNGN